MTSEIRRILNLPDDDPDRPPRYWTDRLSTSGGTWTLRPVQERALSEAHRAQGGLFSIGVGHGKTLLSVLLPHVFDDVDTPALLIPASLREQLARQCATDYGPNFDIHTDIYVASYGEISTKPGLLDRVAPDLVIADECHKLRNREAARTQRVLRYFRNHPDTRFVGMSGTLTTRSLYDYAHLAELALRDRSPVPIRYPTRKAWQQAVDVTDPHNLPGPDAWRQMQALVDEYGDGTKLDRVPFQARKRAARDGYLERLRSAPGVVVTSSSSCDAPIRLVLDSSVPDVPDEIDDALDTLDQCWELPDGSQIDHAFDIAKARRRLLTGFYYRWAWPDGEPDREWLGKRAQWHRKLRAYCRRSIPGRDTPSLVVDALEAGEIDSPPLEQAYRRWLTVADRPKPPTETVWLSDYLLRWTVAEAAKCPDGAIIWYRNRAVARRLDRDFPEVDVVWPNGRDPAGIEPGTVVACSVQSHGTGAHLAQWSRQFWLSPTGNGQTWEQLLGRTHRTGQKADEVRLTCPGHRGTYKKALESARQDARYIERTTGQRQKILFADLIYA